MTVAEIGCGAGNAVFPLLSSNKNPQLNLKAYDYSAQAVNLVQTNHLYQSPPVGTIQAAVWDLSSPELPPGLHPGSVDIVILVFVLSALHPLEWPQAICNIHKVLKPGGLVVMRDYGRYDLTQLRFKTGRLLEENFYIRGDKTRVYFFELDELALLFTGSIAPSVWKTYDNPIKVEDDVEEGDASQAPMPDEERSPAPPLHHISEPTSSTVPIQEKPTPESPKIIIGEETTSGHQPGVHPSLLPQHGEISAQLPHPMFAIEQLGVDRRLIVNRKRQLKMYRVWMQGKFRKLEPST